MPHQYRHILGWFRLISELREHGIRAICVFDGKERAVAKSSEVRASLCRHSGLVDTMQQNRRRNIRRTDALRGEMESDRLSRLLALTKGLDALRLFDKNKRQHFLTSFRSQMAGLESHLIPKLDPNQLSSIDHSLQRHFADVEPSWDQRENYWPDEVDVDELYREDSLSVAADMIAPEEVSETCVPFQVFLREDKYRFIGLIANIALGPKNRIYATSVKHHHLSIWPPTNVRTDIFSS